MSASKTNACLQADPLNARPPFPVRWVHPYHAAPLYEVVQPYLSLPLDQIPDEAAHRIMADFFPYHWDECDPDQRAAYSLERDRALHPALFESANWISLQGEIHDAEVSFERLRSQSGSANTLAKAEARLRALEMQWGQRRRLLASNASNVPSHGGNNSVPQAGIAEAIAFLQANTGVAWNEERVFTVAAKFHIKLYAVAPSWSEMYVIRFVHGSPAVTAFVQPSSEIFVELYQAMVEEIWVTGAALTDSVHYKLLGVSDGTVHLLHPLTVKRSDVRFTRDHLLRILAEYGTLAQILAASENTAEAISAESVVHERNKWDDHAIRRLREEYAQPDTTHDDLAAKYNVSRQFIGKMLKVPKPVKASPWAPAQKPRK